MKKNIILLLGRKPELSGKRSRGDHRKVETRELRLMVDPDPTNEKIKPQRHATS